MRVQLISLGNQRDGGVFALRLHLFHQMLRQIGAVRAKSILDVGCGDGDLSQIMAMRGARVVCLDKQKAWTTAVGKKGKKNRMEFIQADIAHFKTKSKFDIATAFFTLNEIPAPRLQLSLVNVRNALKSGGRFVFVLPHPAFEYAEITPLVTRRGIAQSDYLSDGVPYEASFQTGRKASVKLKEYHFSIAFLVGSLARSGFIIRALRELTYGRCAGGSVLPFYLLMDTIRA